MKSMSLQEAAINLVAAYDDEASDDPTWKKNIVGAGLAFSSALAPGQHSAIFRTNRCPQHFYDGDQVEDECGDCLKVAQDEVLRLARAIAKTARN